MLGAGPVRPFEVGHREVLLIAIPMIIAHLSTPLVSLVATGVVGQLRDDVLIGGIALAAVVFDVVFLTCNFLRGATTGFTAQAVGAQDRRLEQRMLAGGIVISAALGLLILAVHVPIGTFSFRLLGAEGPLLEAAMTYFSWRIWSAPFVLFNFVVFGWVIGRGETVTALLLQTLLNGLNIGLSLWWGLYAGYGIAGVAIAAVVAEGVTAVVGILLIATRTARACWSIPDSTTLRRMLVVNGDMMIRSLSLLLGLSLFTRQSGTLGVDVLAANTILLRLFFIGVAFLDGLATSAEQLVGRAVGAQFRPAFNRVIHLTTLWGFLFAILLSISFAILGGWLIAVVAPLPQIVEMANAFLPYAVVMPLFAVMAFQMDGVYIGATWSREMRNLMLFSLMLYIAALSVLQPLFGNHGLWIALILFQSVRSIAFRARLPILADRTFGKL